MCSRRDESATSDVIKSVKKEFTSDTYKGHRKPVYRFYNFLFPLKDTIHFFACF